MASKVGSDERPSIGKLLARLAIPVLMTALVLIYHLLWKGPIIPSGSVGARILDLALFFVVGPTMAWWGLSAARGLLQKLARSEAAMEERSRLLELRNQQLQSVLQASRSMAAVLDLTQVAELVVTQVTAHTRFTRAALILGPDEQGLYSLSASRHLPEAYLQASIQAMVGPNRSSSPVEWCRLTRQPVVVENLQRDFRTSGLRELFSQAGLHAMIAVPLVCRDQFRGALTVYLEEGGPILTAEISLVSAIATQAAVSLENARLFTETARNRERLDRAVAFLRDAVSALAGTRTGAETLLRLVAQATVRLFAPATVHLHVNRSLRLIPLEIMEGEGMEPDAGEVALSLPVTLDGQDFGRFDLRVPELGRRLDIEEREILQVFVHLTASALGNATAVAEMQQAVTEVERAYMSTLEALTKALELRDHETEGHSRRVVQYTLSVAQMLDLPEAEMVPLIRGSLLHDIGKIGIPDEILKKHGPLTETDWAIMRQHPLIGYRMLQGIEFLAEAMPVIQSHHERMDGSGYPDGLTGTEIPLGARIFAVADAYDAITSDRPYRKGRSHSVAMAEIQAGAGTQFDPRVVEAFMSLPEEELGRIRDRELQLIR